MPACFFPETAHFSETSLENLPEVMITEKLYVFRYLIILRIPDVCGSTDYMQYFSRPLSHSHTCSDGLVCDEPFCEVISVLLHMSVITQYGDSALMMAVREGMTELVSLLLEAGANIDLQNKVKCQ